MEETSFLNFTVQLFLSNSSEKLTELETELQACVTADENCSTVQRYIEEFSRLLESDSTWNGKAEAIYYLGLLVMIPFYLSHPVWPEEDLSRVKECLDNHLFARTYQQTFRPNGDTDIQRDQ